MRIKWKVLDNLEKLISLKPTKKTKVITKIIRKPKEGKPDEYEEEIVEEEEEPSDEEKVDDGFMPMPPN